MTDLHALSSLSRALARPAPVPATLPSFRAASAYHADALTLGGAARIHPKPPVIPMPAVRTDSRDGEAIDMIVLHHTGDPGTAEEVGRYFQNPETKVSANYIVGKDGTIVQSVPDELASWHAGPSAYEGRDRVSRYSLGIEIANLGDGQDPYTDAQYKALAHLVLHLQEKYNIPVERIVGHKDIAMPRGRKSDPSENFSYDRLMQEIAGLKADR